MCGVIFMEYAVEVTNLKKTYKSSNVKALNGLTLHIERKKVLGLLGPNGAGKSTFIKCITGLIKPDSGEIKIFGQGLGHITDKVGYMPEEASIYDFLTGRDFIETIGCLRNMNKEEIHARIEELKDVFDLPNLDILVSSYSKGNKEKILFLATVLHNPKLLILDEPFTGLDPVVIYKAKKFIKEYAEKGNTVILSTHILEMASQICDEVAIINSGKIKRIEKVSSIELQEGSFSNLVDIYLSEVEIKGESK